MKKLYCIILILALSLTSLTGISRDYSGPSPVQPLCDQPEGEADQ